MDESLKSSPKSVDMIIMLADFYIQNNLIDQAIEVLQTTAIEKKEFIKVYLKLIDVYLIKGDEENAKIILEKAKKIDSENEDLKKWDERLNIKVEQNILEEITLRSTEEEKIEEKKGIDSIKAILKEISDKNEEIMGSLLFDETGILIAEDLKIQIDVDGTSAMIAAVYSDVEDVIKRIRLGIFEYMFFEFPKGKLLVLSKKPVLFVILGSKKIELGLMLLYAKETFEKLKENLGL